MEKSASVHRPKRAISIRSLSQEEMSEMLCTLVEIARWNAEDIEELQCAVHRSPESQQRARQRQQRRAHLKTQKQDRKERKARVDSSTQPERNPDGISANFFTFSDAEAQRNDRNGSEPIELNP